MAKMDGLHKLLGTLGGVDTTALGALADQFTSEITALSQEATTATTNLAAIKKARLQLQTLNQAMMTGDNGGPPGPLPGSAPAAQDSPPPSAMPVTPPWQSMDSAPKDKPLVLRLPGVADDGAIGRWGGAYWVSGNPPVQVFPSMWMA